MTPIQLKIVITYLIIVFAVVVTLVILVSADLGSKKLKTVCSAILIAMGIVAAIAALVGMWAL